MIDIDIPSQLAAIYRQVGLEPAEDGENVGVLLRRSYGTGIEDVWDALTDPDRMRRWFMPVSGDLRVGGTFQLEGNASGDILACEPPRLLRLTFGGPTSIVELRLTATADDETTLELEHTVPIAIAQSAAGALYVGPGWDGALMGLGLYLSGEFTGDPVAAANSPEVVAFSKESIHAWTETVEASGTASADEIAAATAVSMAQFAPGESD
jgi:uncharacterized protein YndB with AHSA1/START domain